MMKLEDIAQALHCTVAELGEKVWALASRIEQRGNKGYTFSELRDEPDVLLLYPQDEKRTEAYAAAYAGVLFYRVGKRKRESSGWMVRKTPHWTRAWAELYGWNTERGREALDIIHQRALDDHKQWLAEQERIKLNRPERFELGRFDDYSDDQLKLLSEQLLILGRTFSSKASGGKAEVSIWDMLEVMVHDGHSRIERELYLRHHRMPDFIYPEMPFSHFERGVSGDFKDTLTPDLWLLKRGDADA